MYLEACKTSMIALLCEKILQLLTMKNFRKTLHHRCLTRSHIRFWLLLIDSLLLSIVIIITFTKFSEKLTFLTPWYAHHMVRHTHRRIVWVCLAILWCAYQGVRNVSFSENFANVLNEWSLSIVYLIFEGWRKTLKLNSLNFSHFISILWHVFLLY